MLRLRNEIEFWDIFYQIPQYWYCDNGAGMANDTLTKYHTVVSNVDNMTKWVKPIRPYYNKENKSCKFRELLHFPVKQPLKPE